MTDKGIIKTTITKRIEREYSEDEIEDIMIEHFRSKMGLGPKAPINVSFELDLANGYLRGAVAYFEDVVIEEKFE